MTASIPDTGETGHAGPVWIHQTAPGLHDLRGLLHRLELPDDFFDELLEHDQSPRLERSGGYLLLVLQFPWRDPGSGVASCVLRPLALLLGHQRIWSFSSVRWPFLDQADPSSRGGDARSALVWIFEVLAASYQATLERLRNHLLEGEARLERTQRNEDFYGLLVTSKALTRFYVALASNIVSIFKVSRSAALEWDEASHFALNLAIADLQHARDRAEISASTASSMMDAYAGMVQININHGLKVITVLALVLYIPTLVATIFGVNVPLLEQHSPWTARFAIGTAFLVSLLLTLHFRQRRWL